MVTSIFEDVVRRGVRGGRSATRAGEHIEAQHICERYSLLQAIRPETSFVSLPSAGPCYFGAVGL
eukprot:15430523-Alexandrium_andersonii.AAC.1